MAFIRRAKVVAPSEGKAARLWPLTGEPMHSGSWLVTIVNLSATINVEVVDGPTKVTAGDGLEIEHGKERTFGPMGADELWAFASAEAEVVILATGTPGGS